MNKFTVEIKEVKTEVRVVTLETETQKEAEQIVAEGVNALGFGFVGDETLCESEITVNNKWLEDDCSLTEM